MRKRSRILKKVSNTILFMELLVVATILLCVLFDSCSKSLGMNTVVISVFLLCFGIIIPFAFKPVLISAFENVEMCKESEKYVQQNLSTEYCVEVIPIKDDPEHENFVTKELVKRAKFYAQIMEDGTVMISIKFNNENDRIFYGGLEAEYFMANFKIVNM